MEKINTKSSNEEKVNSNEIGDSKKSTFLHYFSIAKLIGDYGNKENLHLNKIICKKFLLIFLEVYYLRNSYLISIKFQFFDSTENKEIDSEKNFFGPGNISKD